MPELPGMWIARRATVQDVESSYPPPWLFVRTAGNPDEMITPRACLAEMQAGRKSMATRFGRAGWAIRPLVFRVVVLACILAVPSACGRKQEPAGQSASPESQPTVSQSTNPAAPAKPVSNVEENLAGEHLSAFVAIGELGQATSPQERAALAQRFVESRKGGRLTAFISDLKSSPPDASRDELLLAALKNFAQSDPQESLRMAWDLPAMATKQKILSEVSTLWAARDYRGLHAFARQLPISKDRAVLEAAAVRAWSNENPMEAFQSVSRIPLGSGGDMIGIPARILAKKDPQVALDALESVEDREVWATAAGKIFGVMADSNPQLAEKWFFDQDDPEVASTFAYSLGSSLSVRSLPDGIRVLNQIRDVHTADNFIHGMLHRLGDNSERIAGFLPFVEKIADPRYREIAADSAARGVTKTQPDVAIGWLQTLPPDDARARAHQGVGWAYAAKDMDQAQVWLGTLPLGKDRRYAVFGFADKALLTDPPVAASWALTIPDADGYIPLVRSILSRWSGVDPGAASAWAASHGHQALLPPPKKSGE